MYLSHDISTPRKPRLTEPEVNLDCLLVLLKFQVGVGQEHMSREGGVGAGGEGQVEAAAVLPPTYTSAAAGRDSPACPCWSPDRTAPARLPSDRAPG